MPQNEVAARLVGRWDRGWLLGWRDICRSTDERTVIASLLPRVGIGNKIPLLLLKTDARQITGCLAANLSAFAFDYTSRQKIGGITLNFFIAEQLPVLPPETYSQPTPWQPDQTMREWILPRVLELTYTAYDLEPFARDCGYTLTPGPSPMQGEGSDAGELTPLPARGEGTGVGARPARPSAGPRRAASCYAAS